MTRNFVTTKVATKYVKVLLRQKYCRNKHNFVVTKVLSRQAYFCRDKTFAATKMVLVAAPPNDMQNPPVNTVQKPPVNTVQRGGLMECSVATERRAKS